MKTLAGVLGGMVLILVAGETAACTLFEPPPAPGETLTQSVLRRERDRQRHLRSLASHVFLARVERSAGARLRFEPVALSIPDAPLVSMPVGWTREPCVDEPPPDLPPPDAVLTSSPPGDFSVALRALWWRHLDGVAGGSPYRREASVLRTRWVETGVYEEVEGGVLLLATRTPREKAAFLAGLFDEWVVADTGKR